MDNCLDQIWRSSRGGRTPFLGGGGRQTPVPQK